MNLPTLISWMSPFPILGMLGSIFIFSPNLDRVFCKQTVKTLIRRHVLWRLIWVCNVSLCPTKRTLGLYGLTIGSVYFRFIGCWVVLFIFIQRLIWVCTLCLCPTNRTLCLYEIKSQIRAAIAATSQQLRTVSSEHLLLKRTE